MFTFTDALIIAANAHRGKKDMGGVDYIKHPLHLAHNLKIKGASEECQITALLHDVVEDTDVTIEELIRAGVPNSVIEALKLLTHVVDAEYINQRSNHYQNELDGDMARVRAKEDEYLRYIERLSVNEIARAVKIEDLEHNSDIKRVNETDLGKLFIGRRLIKYAKARKLLTGGRVGY